MSVALAMAGFLGAAEPAAPLEPRVYAVAYTHLDTQWRWTVQNTIENDIPSTLRDNFALFEKYPDYKFSFSGAWRYMLAKEYYPELFAELKSWVSINRWSVAGGNLDEYDTNIPSPESLIRHALYANFFFRQEFGKTSDDLLVPDSFGFGYALPSVAAHCGLIGLSCYKLSWGSANPIPFDIGTWRGPDGMGMIAALEPGSFANHLKGDVSQDPFWIAKTNTMGQKCGVPLGYRYFGRGDHGGAADEKDALALAESIHSPKGPLKVISAFSDQLFQELTPEERAKLPTYQGELLMTTHGVGCYTAHAEMKRWNRQNEVLADEAERTAVAADWLGGEAYPSLRLRENWMRFLWNQMHDIVTGTSIQRAYDFSWNDELLAQNHLAAVISDSVGAIARGLDTRGDGIPLIVYNPLTIERDDVAEAEIPVDNVATPEAVRVVGPDGKALPGQIKRLSESRARVLFVAKTPPLSWTVYHLQSGVAVNPRAAFKASDKKPVSPPTQAGGEIAITESSLQNAHYAVTVDHDGNISHIFDKRLSRELLRSPIRLEYFNDVSMRYPAWEIPFNSVGLTPRALVHGPAITKVIEEGPIRGTLEIRRQQGKSVFVQHLGLSAGGAGDRLELETQIDWHDRASLLKLCFPLTARNPKAVFDLGLGVIERGNQTAKLYEVPAQDWAALDNADSAYGIEIVSDCKVGWSKPDDRTLRSTLIHTPEASAGPYPEQGLLDQGRQKMKHAIAAHAGDWREGDAAVLAARVTHPVLVFTVSAHAGNLGKQFSFAKISAPRQVAVKALKMAEAGGEIVIRLEESWGRPVKDVTLAFAGKIKSARELNGCEASVGAATLRKGDLVTDFLPFEVHTFGVILERAKTTIGLPEAVPVSLTLDSGLVAVPGSPVSAPFDAAIGAVPLDLWPASILIDGITFPLASSEGHQAVACQAQVLPINPAVRDRRLFVLAAAAGADASAQFESAGTLTKVTVPALGARVGAADRVSGKDGSVEPGYLHSQEVAWTATHRLDKDGLVEPYLFCNFYKFSVQIPRGATTVLLPDNPAVRLISAVLSSVDNEDARPALPLGEDMQYLNLEQTAPLIIVPAGEKPKAPVTEKTSAFTPARELDQP